MTVSSEYTHHIVSADEPHLLRDLLSVFSDSFEDTDTYKSKQPNKAYLAELLRKDHFIVLVTVKNGLVVGGLVAYELKKFEQERSEIYIYDLAVAEEHRRKGVATGLIQELKMIAKAHGAYVIFVQADLVDTPAISLYTKLGIREDVLHFDIPIE